MGYNPPNMKPLGTVKYLAVHCSATPAKMDVGAKEIDLWHRERGFACIGYHYVIRRDGSIEKGRPDNIPGAHVQGYNGESLGICLVGGVSKVDGNANQHPARQDAMNNYAEDNFTQAQKHNLRVLLTQLAEEHPGAVVQGHRDFPGVTKACPSFDVKPWWSATA